jgi:Lipopolysaccharide kinase (Kdo/WaaP) family
MATHLLLESGIPDLAALGARCPEDLLGTGDPLEGEAAAERLECADGVLEALRLPLPGTLRGRPRGAGTGWVVLRRYGRGGWTRALRSRLTHPRSESLAVREWNLLCGLRAAGVVTPQPLAVVSEEHPVFARRSALVWRALEGWTSAPAWFEQVRDPTRRRRACTALGLTLSRLAAGGFELPLRAEHLSLFEDKHADQPDASADSCGLEQVLAARTRSRGKRELEFSANLRWRRLPEFALNEMGGGRLVSGGQARKRALLGGLLQRLERDPAAELLSRGERRRVAWAAGAWGRSS